MPLPLAAPSVLGSITGALGSFTSGIVTGAKLAGNAAVSGVTAVKDKVTGSPSTLPPPPGAAANSTVGGRRRKSRKSKKSKKKTLRRRR